jgi:hypothetical protein
MAGSPVLMRESVTKLVSRHTFRQRMLAAFRQELVRACNDGSHDAQTDVVAIPRSAARGREDAIVWAGGVSGEAVLEQLVAQDRQEVALAHAGVGL